MKRILSAIGDWAVAHPGMVLGYAAAFFLLFFVIAPLLDHWVGTGAFAQTMWANFWGPIFGLLPGER